LRGEIIAVVLPGAYGKPRPALVVQADLFDAHPSVSVLPITSELRDKPLFRVPITPDAANGLQKPSEIMVDKVTTIPREKMGSPIGVVNYTTMQEVSRCLALFLGIAS
jgi:mRNA interferase MazF